MNKPKFLDFIEIDPYELCIPKTGQNTNLSNKRETQWYISTCLSCKLFQFYFDSNELFALFSYHPKKNCCDSL